MFFSFVINTGVLITAKISVQAAADAAAYAGAATQARQLNAISYLNYDMRRQYKKFVYRYAFVGNVAASSFPNTGGEIAGKYGYPKSVYLSSNIGSLTSVPIKVPVVCMPITASAEVNQNCSSLNLPSSTSNIASSFSNGILTMTTAAFLEGVAKIEEMQQGLCANNGSINLFVLTEWLMRGDISPSAISSTLDSMSIKLNQAEKDKLKNNITILVQGLGLYPRNIINLMRIETLEKFLNAPAKKDVQKDTIDTLEHSSIDAEVSERTIQSFKSALSNLNNEVIPHNSVIMQELQNSNQITINPVKASFNAYVQYINGATAGNDTICNSKIIPFAAKSTPVGVVKASTTPVHYAVKIKAKAHLLFLPIRDGIELEAVAAAKPFGSRIGPAGLSESDFVENIQPGSVNGDPVNDCHDQSVKCNVPNLKVTDTETFYSQSYLKSLAAIGVENNSYNFKGMSNAMAPQPHEVGHYNIIPPPVDDMKFEFIPYGTNKDSNIYRFYAPIFTGAGNPTQKISAFMDEVFGLTQVSGTGSFGIDMMALKSTLQSQLINYVTGPMNSGQATSEHGETTTFAAIELPMAPAPSPGPIVTANPNNFWLTRSEEVISSWAPAFVRHSSGNDFKPRFGYSVKFVAMHDVLGSGMQATDDDLENVSH